MLYKTVILFLIILLLVGCGLFEYAANREIHSDGINSDEIIFQENFDNQPDWHSGLLINYTNPYINDGLLNPVNKTQLLRDGNIVPIGWDSVYQDGQIFTPRNNYPNSNENIEILGANSLLARGGSGKSALFWRESHGTGHWNSDGTLNKHLSDGYESLYIEFWIKFDPNMTVGKNESSKIFRVESWNREGSEFQAFPGGNLGPILIWNWKSDTYGVRNVITSRGGPHGENYFLDSQDNIGASYNFLTSIENQGLDGITEYPVDRENGGLVKDNITGGVALHKQVFGNRGQWSKVAFFVKMNSAPGVKDGEFIQWLNGRRLLTRKNIPWVGFNTKNKMVKWNAFAIGGNDHFNSHSLDKKREEYYSIDDIKVFKTIPESAEIDINI